MTDGEGADEVSQDGADRDGFLPGLEVMNPVSSVTRGVSLLSLQTVIRTMCYLAQLLTLKVSIITLAMLKFFVFSSFVIWFGFVNLVEFTNIKSNLV